MSHKSGFPSLLTAPTLFSAFSCCRTGQWETSFLILFSISVTTRSWSWPWPFLVSHQSWLDRGHPHLFCGPTWLRRGFPLLQHSAGTMPWAGSCSTLLHPAHPTTPEQRLCNLFPPARAVSIRWAKMSMQAGLNGCCRLWSSHAAVQDSADAISPSASFGYMDCAVNGWDLNFADEQPDPCGRCKPLLCGGAWSDRGHGLRHRWSRACKLWAFKIFGLPGCWQWHSLKIFQLNVLTFIYNATLTEFYFILSLIKYIVHESKGLMAD